MGEDKHGGDLSMASSPFFKSGDRQMFTMVLRPGETTIVSWKKLMNDANKVNGSFSTSPPKSLVSAQTRLESCIAPVAVRHYDSQEGEEVKDEAVPSRFSAVIEKIERLYMVDEYFEVDNSAIKHDGFFVNRGQLERSDPSALFKHQPKKRRRKDLAKDNGENDDGRLQNKHAKLRKMATCKSSSAHLNVSVFFSNKISSDLKTAIDPSALNDLNGDTTMMLVAKDIEKKETEALLSKNASSRFKDVATFFDSSHSKHHDKGAYSKSQSDTPSIGVDELDLSARATERNGIHEMSDVDMLEGKHSPMTRTPHMHKKDGSNARLKGSMLEKAIRELEKMVAESRPPSVEIKEVDNSSQAIKRRLPREIKMKLAKVARLAQASHGKVSKDLLNRLMSILGHLIQLRTLKRNLKVMISMGFSAKQEIDDRFQLMKKEVIELIKMRAPSTMFKALEQQAGATEDLREIATEEKDVSTRKFSMDAALEDKICDLYDLYGLDQEAGPQIRRLYTESYGLMVSWTTMASNGPYVVQKRDEEQYTAGKRYDIFCFLLTPKFLLNK
ncbi:hypothetical protein G4B88_016070 [Cannabis sativa]|uniref:Wound-responsive family protein n=1 Tax=Cannabis sativa TaxID=3483 RepID=A0A7J6F019_CANSA|nr:hypothetical protein G4B88_016070 [Cannabis sativa]